MKTFRRKVSNRTEASRSQRGASLPLSLFLFMICAILTSVVLSAGTAVAGRQSQLIESDQRYYSVVSATEIMKQAFNKKIVFELETETGESSDGNSTNSDSSANKKVKSLKCSSGSNGATVQVTASSISSLELSQQAALYLLLGTDSFTDEESFERATLHILERFVTDQDVITAEDNENGSSNNQDSLALPKCELVPGPPQGEGANSIPSDIESELKVNVDATVQVDEAALQIELDSPEGASDSGQPAFKTTMQFKADVTKESPMQNSDKSEESSDITTYTVTWAPEYIMKAGN